MPRLPHFLLQTFFAPINTQRETFEVRAQKPELSFTQNGRYSCAILTKSGNVSVVNFKTNLYRTTACKSEHTNQNLKSK
jgi:hypothetical protein